MDTVTIELELPEELANTAESVGLLANEKTVSIVNEELEREQAAQRLREWLNVVRQDGEKGPSLDEIQDEIRAMRAEKRKMRGND